MKSKLAKAAVIALTLNASVLSMSALAQTTPTPPDRTTQTSPVVRERDDDHGNWGWLGLLGLLGLAGLLGKRDRGVVTHSTNR